MERDYVSSTANLKTVFIIESLFKTETMKRE